MYQQTYICAGQLSKCPSSMANCGPPPQYGFHPTGYTIVDYYSTPMVQHQAMCGNANARNILKYQ